MLTPKVDLQFLRPIICVNDFCVWFLLGEVLMCIFDAIKTIEIHSALNEMKLERMFLSFKQVILLYYYVYSLVLQSPTVVNTFTPTWIY